jgi:hypothetical protein
MATLFSNEVEWMAPFACGFARIDCGTASTAKYMLPAGNGFEMVGAHAAPVSTTMVENQIVRNVGKE